MWTFLMPLMWTQSIYSNEVLLSKNTQATQIPPLAITAPTTTDNPQHWWAGTVSLHTYRNAIYVSFQHTIPNKNPSTDEFIYVLISCYDTNGSYDQIGFVANNDSGRWEIVYSWTTVNYVGGPLVYHFYYIDLLKFCLLYTSPSPRD